MKVKANGISFHCQVDGRDGAPWVVFSNSLATNLSMWDAQTEALQDLENVAFRHMGRTAECHVLQEMGEAPLGVAFHQRARTDARLCARDDA